MVISSRCFPIPWTKGLKVARLIVLALGLTIAGLLKAATVDADATIRRGQELEKQGKYQDAIAEYDKLVQAFPKATPPLAFRGWARHLAGDDAGGLRDLEKALALKPGDAGLLNTRASIHAAQNSWRAAAADYADIVSQNPANARAQRDLAFALMRDGRPQEALPAADRAVVLSPKSLDYLTVRARIHEMLGRFSAALDDYDSALALNPPPATANALTTSRQRIAAKQATEFSGKPIASEGNSLFKPPTSSPSTAATATTRAAATVDPAPARLPATPSVGETRTEGPTATVAFREPGNAAPTSVAAASSAAAPGPVSPDPPSAPPERIDFKRLSRAQYRAAVSAAMEQLRIVLGPREQAENTSFEKTWAHAFDFPCAEVVEYLNRLNPLLARFISLKASAAFLLDRFNEQWREAMTTTALGNEEAGELNMAQVARYGEQLKAVRDELNRVAAAIAALGDPPDAAALKKRQHKQADAAVQYVQDVATGDLWTKLHDCDAVSFALHGRFRYRIAGNLPRTSEANVRREGDSDIAPFDEVITQGRTILAENISGSYGIEWSGPVFFGSRQITLNSRFASRDSGGAKVAEISFCGVLSEDGRRLIDFFWMLHSRESARRWTGVGQYQGGAFNDELTQMLQLAGDQVRYQDSPPTSLPGLFYTANDFPPAAFEKFRRDAAWRLGQAWAGSKVEVEIKPAAAAGLLRRFAYWRDRSIQGELDGTPTPVKANERGIDAQLTDVEFRFWRRPQINPDEPPTKDFLSGPELLRAKFDNPDLPWAKILTAESKNELAQRRLNRLASFVEEVEYEAALDAYRKAMAQAKREEAARKAEIATNEKDIASIEQYLATMRAERERVANAQPLDATLLREIDFRIVGQESEIIAKKDLIHSLATGEVVHTATPFDEMCRTQVFLSAHADVERLANVDRGRRTFEALKAKLDDSERRALVQKVGAMIDAGKGTDPNQWRNINAEAYALVQKKLEADQKVADAETAAWERDVWLAEKATTAVDLTFAVVSGAGEFQIAGLLYSFTTATLNNGLDAYYSSGSPYAGLKQGLYEGTKAVAGGLSNYVDYAWTAAETYLADPKAPYYSRVFATAGALGGKWLMNEVTGAAMNAVVQKIRTVQTAAWKPTAAQAIAAAKYQQQLEMDHALARDFLDSYKQLRLTQLKGGGKDSPEAAKLLTEVRRKACSVNASYGAKAYIKYQALPVEQRGFSKIMNEVHAELIPQFRRQMAEGASVNGKSVGKWGGEMKMSPIRNAASAGTSSMDFDLALHQQPDWVPDGAGGLRRNVWLTRDGVPASPEQFQEAGQKVWEQLYRRATGYSARTSFENVTTLQHPEAYKDLAWTKVTQPGGADALDWRWSQQAGDVTRIKHYDMLDRQPMLGHYQKVQESCRGTAKDIQTKVLPLLESIRTKKASAMNAAERTHLNEVKTFWGRVQEVMGNFGSGKMHPLEAEHQIYLLSGGRGLNDLTDRVGTVIESLGKSAKK